MNAGIKKRSVLAHPYDEILGCGGKLALHVQAGNQVLVVIAIDGRSGAGNTADKP